MMFDKSPLHNGFGQGTITFPAEQLTAITVGESVKQFLTTYGLPAANDKEEILDIRFICEARQMTCVGVKDVSYWKIGEHGDRAIIGIEQATGNVYEISIRDAGKVIFINSDLSSFLLLLLYFKQYIRKKEAAGPPPMVLSREELLKKLEALKIRATPLKSAADNKEQFNQQQESKAMRQYIVQTDPSALHHSENWWSIILEQVEDEIL